MDSLLGADRRRRDTHLHGDRPSRRAAQHPGRDTVDGGRRWANHHIVVTVNIEKGVKIHTKRPGDRFAQALVLLILAGNGAVSGRLTGTSFVPF